MVWGYCGAGELLCGGVTGWGGCSKSQVVRKLPHGAVVMWEFHCEGVAECVGHGGYQTFIYGVFWRFLTFLRVYRFCKEINDSENLQWLKSLPGSFFKVYGIGKGASVV